MKGFSTQAFREFPAEATGNFLRACTRFVLTDRYRHRPSSLLLSQGLVNVSRPERVVRERERKGERERDGTKSRKDVSKRENEGKGSRLLGISRGRWERVDTSTKQDWNLRGRESDESRGPRWNRGRWKLGGERQSLSERRKKREREGKKENGRDSFARGQRGRRTAWKMERAIWIEETLQAAFFPASALKETEIRSPVPPPIW